MNPLRAIRDWVGESPSTRDPRLFAYMVRTYGWSKALGVGLYDESFYAEHLLAEPAYAAFAAIIHDLFEPASVCDFGCGNGFLIGHLQARGAEVVGVEGSPHAVSHAPEAVRPRIRRESVSAPLDLGTFELCISTEVAEHIPKARAVGLIDNLVRHATKAIVFTAAAPGQWGDGHINCRPQAYWRTLFHERGWSDDEARLAPMTERLRQSQQVAAMLPWIPRNLMLFRPAANPAR
jgi:SAM-dependent methyltransferase